MADYRVERDAVLTRWYGEISRPGRRKSTSWPNPIGDDDYVGIPTPVNAPFAYLLHGDCLVWLHALDSGGYGKLTIEGKRRLAHRVAYVQDIGELSTEQQVNHLCDRPYCVQPAHLYAGDHQDNADDARLFALNSLVSPVDWVLLAPDAEYHDPLLKRLKSSERFGFVQPWESPTKPSQAPLDEFECPGHDFRIPAGESTRVCRICERFEHEDELSSNFYIAAIGKEIYPVSQLIDSVLNKVVSLELGQDDWQGWREKCCYRGSIMVMGGNHVLRNCGCHFCQSDRRIFRENLDQSLTPVEATVLDICDRMEPLICQQIRQMRRDVFEWAFPRVDNDFTDEQKALFLNHLDGCPNTVTEVRSAAHQAERLLGYFLHAVATYDSLDEFNKHDGLYGHWLPAVTPLPNDPDTRGLCISSATASCEKIFNLLDNAVVDFELLHETMWSSDAEELRMVTRALLSTVLSDVITQDLFGRTRHSRVYPHPHQSCVQDVLFPRSPDDNQETVIRRAWHTDSLAAD